MRKAVFPSKPIMVWVEPCARRFFDPLFASAASLPGIGPKNAQLLDRLLGGADHPARVLDVLLHLPYDGIDRRDRPTIAQAQVGAVSTIKVRVVEHRPSHAKGPYRVLTEDGTGDLTLVFFRANGSWIEKALPVGATRSVPGLINTGEGAVHPQLAAEANNPGRAIQYEREESPPWVWKRD